MRNIVVVVSVLLFTLMGCSGKEHSVEVSTEVVKKSSRTKGYFNVYWNAESISIPQLKEYQEITPENDKEMFDILDMLEKGPNSTNIAFLLSNADYMGVITGVRKNIKDSYIVIRSSEEFQNHTFTKEEFQAFTSILEKNYQRIIKSNYIKDALDKYANNIKRNVKSEFNESIPLTKITVDPIKFKRIDDRSFFNENLLTFKGVEGDKKILSISTILNYKGKIFVVIVNSGVKGELKEEFIAEKERFSKDYIGAFPK